MTTPITPALTPEQWRQSIVTEGQYSPREVFLVDGVLAVWCGQQHRFPSATDDPTDVTPHAIAALALHEQPFGFTRADVEMLDDPWGCGNGISWSIREWHSLRDRIAALLPPE